MKVSEFYLEKNCPCHGITFCLADILLKEKKVHENLGGRDP